MNKMPVYSNKTSVNYTKQEVELRVINMLKVNINCDIERIGNKTTIWITENKE